MDEKNETFYHFDNINSKTGERGRGFSKEKSCRMAMDF